MSDPTGIDEGDAVGADVGFDVGIVVGIIVGILVGMSVGGSGTTHLESTQTLSGKQHILIGSPMSSNAQIPPGGTHVLPPVV